MKVCIFITVVFLLFSCKKKEDVAVDNKFVFLSFGFPDFREDHLRKVIDEKWNIKRVRVAGCVVTDELLDDELLD
ncbi:hypothetical protein AB4Y90_17070, partial [Chryseobacterium sp. 2TAF14]|uniref:hypothetical protein n=1 Tax=Chryseobacterium sp. 2TAF14 TaxID=3233007 RepID=UPI003F92FBCE